MYMKLARRGGNTCFEPTYEELKPDMIRLYLTRQDRFEPTYEELKPQLLLYAPEKKECFEPTYEELKLGKPLHKIMYKNLF